MISLIAALFPLPINTSVTSHFINYLSAQEPQPPARGSGLTEAMESQLAPLVISHSFLPQPFCLCSLETLC